MGGIGHFDHPLGVSDAAGATSALRVNGGCTDTRVRLIWGFALREYECHQALK